MPATHIFMRLEVLGSHVHPCRTVRVCPDTLLERPRFASRACVIAHVPNSVVGVRSILNSVAFCGPTTVLFMLMPAAGGRRQCRVDHLLVNWLHSSFCSRHTTRVLYRICRLFPSKLSHSGQEKLRAAEFENPESHD